MPLHNGYLVLRIINKTCNNRLLNANQFYCSVIWHIYLVSEGRFQNSTQKYVNYQPFINTIILIMEQSSVTSVLFWGDQSQYADNADAGEEGLVR